MVRGGIARALRGLARGLEAGEAQLADARRTSSFLRGRLEFRSRPDDVYVATYPRSGTTWAQFMLHLLAAGRDLDFEHICQVTPWFERSLALGTRVAADFEALPSPRIFKTHLPRRWLPREGRFVYVRREGLDVAISYYHLYRSHLGYRGDFDAFFERFMRGDVQYGSWFKHVAAWERHTSDPAVLALRYEDMRRDPQATLRALARFAGLPLAEQDLPELLRLTSLEYMRAHQSQFDPITETLLDQGLVRGQFVREGRVGGGQAAVSAPQRARFERAAERAPFAPELELDLPSFLH